MKDLIKKKLDHFTDKILNKEEISNEEAMFLLSMLSKIEQDEEKIEFEKEKLQTKEMMKQIHDML